MKQTHSQIEQSPVRDTAKVQIGAMTPSFPPAKRPVESPKKA